MEGAMSKDGDFILRMQNAIRTAQSREGRRRARESAGRERLCAALDLFIDRLRFEGIDPASPVGTLIIHAWAANHVEEQEYLSECVERPDFARGWGDE
jgi:hypothetical protein